MPDGRKLDAGFIVVTEICGRGLIPPAADQVVIGAADGILQLGHGDFANADPCFAVRDQADVADTADQGMRIL